MKLKPFEIIPCANPNKICGLKLPDGGEILIRYTRKKKNQKNGQQLGILTITSQTTDFDSLAVVKGQQCQNSVQLSLGFIFD